MIRICSCPINERVRFPDVLWFQRRLAIYNKDESRAEENICQKQTGPHQYLARNHPPERLIGRCVEGNRSILFADAAEHP